MSDDWPYLDPPNIRLNVQELGEIAESETEYKIVCRHYNCRGCQERQYSRVHIGGAQFCPNCRAWLNRPKGDGDDNSDDN